MGGLPNTHVYEEEWRTKLQEELDEPNKWKDICEVEYTNSRVIHNPYLTDATVQTGERGTPYTYQAVVHTDQNTVIDTYRVLAQFIDRADLAQSGYAKQMQLAERQGVLLNETLETNVFLAYGSMTTFDGDEIGGAAGSITLSATNVDDVIRGIRREIAEANGQTLLERNGGFIVWRPSDMEYVEAFAQANGFNMSDAYLKSGAVGKAKGVDYMGLTHYTSNLLSGGHIIAGVKKAIHLGILKDTYGDIMVDTQDPSARSGISVVSRVDFKVMVWQRMIPVVFDVRLA